MKSNRKQESKKPADDGCSWLKNPKNMFESDKASSSNKKEGPNLVTTETKAKNKSMPKQEKSKPTVENRDRDNIRFDLCEKLIEKVKNNDPAINSLFKNLLEMFRNSNADNTQCCALKAELLDKLMSNLLQADRNQLIKIKDGLKEFLFSTSLFKFIADLDDIKDCEPFEQHQNFHIFTGTFNLNGVKQKVVIKEITMGRGEAVLLSKLNHPNVIKLLAIDKNFKTAVLEFMLHGNLRLAILQKKMDMSNKNLLKLLVGIATGMEYIHSQNILHNDLALRNVFVNQHNQCKIGNFMFSAYVGDSNGEYLMEDGLTFAVDNIAPEVESTGKYTFKNDVWSMGILCWDMFYLKKEVVNPFFRNMTLHMIRQYNDTNLKKPSDAPDVLWNFVEQKMLQRNPSDRADFTNIKGVLKNISFD